MTQFQHTHTSGAPFEPAGDDLMAYTFDIYQARDGWRWKMIAGNGEIVADGSEAYASKANALRAVAALQTEMPDEGEPHE